MISITKMFSQTLHDAPAEAETRGYQLLLRAGYICHLDSGLYGLLPLAKRMLGKFIQLLTPELEENGSLEIDMPSFSPTPGNHSIPDQAVRNQLLISKIIRSHRQLPALVHYVSRNWNENPSLKLGLLGSRETIHYNSIALAANVEEQYSQVQLIHRSAKRFFEICQLPVKLTTDRALKPDDPTSSRIYLPMVNGIDSFLECPKCVYSARQEVARFKRDSSPAQEPKPLQKVATPNSSTIQELADFLKISSSQTAKAVFWMAVLPDHPHPVFLFLVVRGDMEASQEKVKLLFSCQQIWTASDDDIRRIGAEPGYASPIGIKPTIDLQIIVDEAIPLSPNLVAGANEHGFHLLNTNYGRDYTANLVADIAMAQPGSPCPQCKSGLALVNGFELATISTKIQGECNFQDLDGTTKPVLISSLNVQLSRVLASVAETHQDSAGLCLPPKLAPFHVHMIVLKGKTIDTAQIATEVCQALNERQLEVILDDRNESAGVKFNDADLIGLPIRITISERSIQAGGVEYKKRNDPEKMILPISEIIAQIQVDLAQ